MFEGAQPERSAGNVRSSYLPGPVFGIALTNVLIWGVAVWGEHYASAGVGKIVPLTMALTGIVCGSAVSARPRRAALRIGLTGILTTAFILTVYSSQVGFRLGMDAPVRAKLPTTVLTITAMYTFVVLMFYLVHAAEGYFRRRNHN
jgi:hypothetical protein